MVTAAGRGRERGSRPCHCPWLGALALGWAVGRGPWTWGGAVDRGAGPWAGARGPWP